jgi:hypothetical protein
MERLSSIASKTFVDDLRSEPTPTKGTVQAPSSTSLVPSSSKKLATVSKKDGARDYSAEREAALLNTSDRVADLAVSGRDQTLGDEYIKLAQAMILCTLPHSATKETKITRRARLGDGTTLAVTFSATADGIGLPHGADRKLLFWLLDRAIRNDSPFVPWSSAAEFGREMGLEKGGRTNKQIKERFSRIAGLVISISRKGTEATALDTFPVIARAYLPNSIAGDTKQASLPEMGDRFGVLLHAPLFQDIKKHNIVMPRRLWLDLKGPTPVQDLVFWLYYRCYAASSESIIPWDALSDQFPQTDSNPYRIRQHLRKAIKVLKILWPAAQVKEDPRGLWVAKASAGMLDDDVTKNRIRKL